MIKIEYSRYDACFSFALNSNGDIHNLFKNSFLILRMSQFKTIEISVDFYSSLNMRRYKNLYRKPKYVNEGSIFSTSHGELSFLRLMYLNSINYNSV